MKSQNRSLSRTNYHCTTSPKNPPMLMTAEDVLKALGRYTKESNQIDRQTAATLGVKNATLAAWLEGLGPPKKHMLARLAGFLRRVGYL
jgi:transcriptional regulator with XRE-family HTH domain